MVCGRPAPVLLSLHRSLPVRERLEDIQSLRADLANKLEETEQRLGWVEAAMAALSDRCARQMKRRIFQRLQALLRLPLFNPPVSRTLYDLVNRPACSIAIIILARIPTLSRPAWTRSCTTCFMAARKEGTPPVFSRKQPIGPATPTSALRISAPFNTMKCSGAGRAGGVSEASTIPSGNKGSVITRSPAARERPHPCDAVLLAKRSKLTAPDFERLAKAVVGGLLSVTSLAHRPKKPIAWRRRSRRTGSTD